MKNFFAIFALSALASLPMYAGEWTGYISDTECATEHSKSGTAAEWIHPKVFENCAKQCVKDGSAPIFLTQDNQVVKIDAGSIDKIMPQLGHKVKVTGTIDGGTLKVDTITGLDW